MFFNIRQLAQVPGIGCHSRGQSVTHSNSHLSILWSNWWDYASKTLSDHGSPPSRIRQRGLGTLQPRRSLNGYSEGPQDWLPASATCHIGKTPEPRFAIALLADEATWSRFTRYLDREWMLTHLSSSLRQRRPELEGMSGSCPSQELSPECGGTPSAYKSWTTGTLCHPLLLMHPLSTASRPGLTNTGLTPSTPYIPKTDAVSLCHTDTKLVTFLIQEAKRPSWIPHFLSK